MGIVLFCGSGWGGGGGGGGGGGMRSAGCTLCLCSQTKLNPASCDYVFLYGFFSAQEVYILTNFAFSLR